MFFSCYIGKRGRAIKASSIRLRSQGNSLSLVLCPLPLAECIPPNPPAFVHASHENTNGTHTGNTPSPKSYSLPHSPPNYVLSQIRVSPAQFHIYHVLLHVFMSLLHRSAKSRVIAARTASTKTALFRTNSVDASLHVLFFMHLDVKKKSWFS